MYLDYTCIFCGFFLVSWHGSLDWAFARFSVFPPSKWNQTTDLIEIGRRIPSDNHRPLLHHVISFIRWEPAEINRWVIERVHMTSRRPCWRSKQRNGGHVEGVKYSFGDWTLFLCKFLLLFHYANMASGHMSEHTLKELITCVRRENEIAGNLIFVVQFLITRFVNTKQKIYSHSRSIFTCTNWSTFNKTETESRPPRPNTTKPNVNLHWWIIHDAICDFKSSKHNVLLLWRDHVLQNK